MFGSKVRVKRLTFEFKLGWSWHKSITLLFVRFEKDWIEYESHWFLSLGIQGWDQILISEPLSILKNIPPCKVSHAKVSLLKQKNLLI